MFFIRIKTRLARGSAAKTGTSEKSVGADRCFRADDEAIRTKTTIFSKPLTAWDESKTLEQVPFLYMASSSTSNTSVALGGITPPAPRAP